MVHDALAEAGARATFFLVGEQVEAEPALAQEIVRRATTWSCTATLTWPTTSSHRMRLGAN